MRIQMLQTISANSALNIALFVNIQFAVSVFSSLHACLNTRMGLADCVSVSLYFKQLYGLMQCA